MQPDYVGKQEDLYLWCLIAESKTCRQYACPTRYSCGCYTCIQITETKQILKLETIGVRDQHSHIGGKMHASKSAPGVVDFLAQRAKHLRMKNLVSGAPLIFLFHCSDITVSTAALAGDERNDLRRVPDFLPMWRLSFKLFGQQSPAAPYWRSCAAEEMKSAITNVSYAASQTLNLKPIHSKAIVSMLNLYLTVVCYVVCYS
jgi:hypothetical protein